MITLQKQPIFLLTRELSLKPVAPLYLRTPWSNRDIGFRRLTSYIRLPVRGGMFGLRTIGQRPKGIGIAASVGLVKLMASAGHN